MAHSKRSGLCVNESTHHMFHTSSYVGPVGLVLGGKIVLFPPKSPEISAGWWCPMAAIGRWQCCPPWLFNAAIRTVQKSSPPALFSFPASFVTAAATHCALMMSFSSGKQAQQLIWHRGCQAR